MYDRSCAPPSTRSLHLIMTSSVIGSTLCSNIGRTLWGSGASRDLGREKTRWHTEDRQTVNHGCFISSHFSSLKKVSRSDSQAELGLLPADAPEPIVSTRTPTSCRHGAKTSDISKHRRHPVPFRGAGPSCSRNHRFVQMLPQRLLRASDRAD